MKKKNTRRTKQTKSLNRKNKKEEKQKKEKNILKFENHFLSFLPSFTKISKLTVFVNKSANC